MIREIIHNMAGDDGHMIWPSLGSQLLYEFTTQGLYSMCFPEIILNRKGGPTVIARLRDASISHSTQHIMEFNVFGSI